VEEGARREVGPSSLSGSGVRICVKIEEHEKHEEGVEGEEEHEGA